MIVCAPEVSAHPHGDEVPSYGGTLVWGVHTRPTIMNPLLTTHSVSMALLDLIFNKLVRINTRGEIEPDLAERWEISADGRNYTFYLRRGVQFHDGVECTAEDVKFTFEKLRDIGLDSPFRHTYEKIEDIELLDRYTVLIRLKQPSVAFIYRLVKEIVPRHILGNGDIRQHSFNRRPVGTGPFRFEAWTEDDRITLQYNPAYYEGRPYLDTIEVRTYPDLESLWTGLMRQEVDYAGFISRENYEVAKKDPAFRTHTVPADGYYVLFYNLTDTFKLNQLIREAIAYGINREALIQKIAGGYGMVCHGPFHEELIKLPSGHRQSEYNPVKSKALIEKAGWEDTNNDGIFSKGGKELQLNLLVDKRDSVYMRMAMLIRQQLQEIGVKLKVLDYADEKELHAYLDGYDPHIHLKMIPSYVDPDQIKDDWYAGGDSVWKNSLPELDYLFEMGDSVFEESQRIQVYRDIQRVICSRHLVCFLYYPYAFHAVSSELLNTDEFFTASMPIYTIKNWCFNAKNERR